MTSSPFTSASAYAYGPQGARNPDLEVLLTDGLGGFALSSLAGVPTRCYSGLVASQQPPVARFCHLVSPLERLEVGSHCTTLHALEIAPGVFEGKGLDLLSGVTVWDLLPEREQLWRGVRVRRHSCVPQESGALVLLYEVRARHSVTLTLGGFFVDREMHAVHGAPPRLDFSGSGNEVRVQGERGTLVRLVTRSPGTPDAAGPQVEALSPRPFTQRLFYRADQARGETPHDYAQGCELWRVTLPPGGGEVALVVQAVTPDRRELPDPWAALAAETARRRSLAQRAWETTGVTDELVATLAVAADAYLVRRGPQEAPERSVIAGYPWFADWGRDAMIAFSGLTLVTGRTEDARNLLLTFLGRLDRGLIPNHFTEGGGLGDNSVDAPLWLAVAIERYVLTTGDAALARQALPQLRQLIGNFVQGTRHGIGMDPADALLSAGGPGTQLTWMDAKIHDWVVTPRHGKPVEIQALWLAALGAELRLSQALNEPPRYAEVLERAHHSFRTRFWNMPDRTAAQDTTSGEAAGETQSSLGVGRRRGPVPSALLLDRLDAAGQPDTAVRPNSVIALALNDTPVIDEQLGAVLAQVEAELLTPVGLHTLSPGDPRYLGNYGGPQLLRDAAYHQGTVWPWLIGSYVELLLSRGEVQRARAALTGLTGHLWEAGVGHVSEVFSGDELRPGGCPFQAWSVAELLRAHVLVSLSEQQLAAVRSHAQPASRQAE